MSVTLNPSGDPPTPYRALYVVTWDGVGAPAVVITNAQVAAGMAEGPLKRFWLMPTVPSPAGLTQGKLQWNFASKTAVPSPTAVLPQFSLNTDVNALITLVFGFGGIAAVAFYFELGFRHSLGR